MDDKQADDAKESWGNTPSPGPRGSVDRSDVGEAFLGIPDSVDHTAHAVAANERREAFDGWSIFERPGQADSDRVEKRFLGAHSDIGGGYKNSDLSDVAFMWMVEQAEQAGLAAGAIDRGYIADERYNIITDPIANDPVYNWENGPDGVYTPGRVFRYLDDGGRTDIKQDTVADGADNLGFNTAVGFLEQDIYQDEDLLGFNRGSDGLDSAPLRQDGAENYAYEKWLREHYGLAIKIQREEGNP